MVMSGHTRAETGARMWPCKLRVVTPVSSGSASRDAAAAGERTAGMESLPSYTVSWRRVETGVIACK